MSRRLFAILFSLCLICLSVRSYAQDREAPSVRVAVDLDFRSRTSAAGSESPDLHTGSLRVEAAGGPGLKATFYTVEKYGARVVQQASVEKTWGAQRWELGQVRLPFGIYDFEETYASGLIDYAMPRGDYALHSVDWGVPGVRWAGGSPALQMEAALFQGRAAGVWSNRNDVGGGALRAQTAAGNLILGASIWDGYQSVDPANQIRGAVHLGGLDLRYTRPHLLLRGEYLRGVLGGDRMDGAYLDAYYHLPHDAKTTLVARAETLRPEASGPRSWQVTLGARYVATPEWILALNWRRNNAARSYAATWTPPAERSGDLFFQVYRKLRR